MLKELKELVKVFNKYGTIIIDEHNIYVTIVFPLNSICTDTVKFEDFMNYILSIYGNFNFTVEPVEITWTQPKSILFLNHIRPYLTQTEKDLIDTISIMYS